MATLKDYKTVAAPFANAEEIIRVVYDFAKDGGATGAKDILVADGELLVTGWHMVVKTAGTSGGSATLKVGVTGDDDSFLKTTEGAVASLTANAVFGAKPELTEGTPNTIAPRLPYRLATGEKILQTIGTAALTAGKVEYTIKVMKA